MWINVKDAPYSAKGNGTDDDTAAIQAALDDAAFGSDSERNAVYFPLGTYRITDTLELTHCQGVRLIGVGNMQGTPVYLPPGYVGRQCGAVLFWDGAPDGTLLRIFGSYYGSLESLTFVGATPQKYKFSTTTTDSDPGDGFLRFNDSSFTSVTKIFADDKNSVRVAHQGLARQTRRWKLRTHYDREHYVHQERRAKDSRRHRYGYGWDRLP